MDEFNIMIDIDNINRKSELSSLMTEQVNNQLKELALKKVDQIIQSFQKEIRLEFGHHIREFFQLFSQEEIGLQQLYQAYKKQLPAFDFQCSQRTILYTYEGTSCTIAYLGKQFSLEEEAFARLLSNTIEIMREVLPLGSIVELDPAYFKPDRHATSPSKVVITGRFVSPKNDHSYFPYVGVLYPIGEIKAGAQIHFTAPLIKKVIHQGYKDEMEEAFVFLMKQELIVEKDMNSIEFSHHDMNKLQQEMAAKQKVGEV
ncbi:DUF4176 domain-containing protein [Bacillus aquiflavi]|uniref:DUF4176 domain-containing protein n=1 Tax=Bacillus aquiflavi TaxID=2672567 RepID=A0A6B3W6R4_9BACI|nr:DUF4176 domain-containing protein [Bacillus aquiflavi]MBA4538735.1 DUF4176 domain-containing protein [Bacillus aquiflavi]NEY83094.1 DUF4176 domain-containing protein [Bacillus aquiflavi]